MGVAPGTIVARRYRLDRLLGEGGMGVVWAATHLVTRKTVALKMLKPERATDPVVQQRFVREARAASAVRHPNIIEIHDVIELDDGSPAMVMDLLDGESLGARLAREPVLPLDALAPILVQVLSAVGSAHAAGIVHRDLKPDNIFLVPGPGGPFVRVLDFGIAKVLSVGGEMAVSRGLTNTGAVLGTPFYMAPEQIFGERQVDARADVWALGVILYECLAGRRPTEAENVGQILRMITNDAIVPLADVAPGVPSDVTALVDRMLACDKTARLASLGEAYAVLARHASGAASRPFGEPMAHPRSELGSLPDDSARHAVVAHADASPTARTLASTTASTTADRVAGGFAPPRRGRLVLGAGVLAVALAGGAALFASMRPTSVDARASAGALVASPPSAPPRASVELPPVVASASASAPPPLAPAATSASPAPRARGPVATAARPVPTAAPEPPPKANLYEHM